MSATIDLAKRAHRADHLAGGAADLSTAFARPGRVLPAVQFATNCWASPSPSQSGGPQTQAGTSRSLHKATVGVTDIRLTYGGWSVQSLADTDNSASLPISAAVEYPLGGSLYRVTFGGRTVATVDPGGLVHADPLGVTIPAGAAFAVRTYTSSTSWFANTASFGNSGATGGFSTSDLTAPGSGAVPNATHWIMAPFGITGTPLDAVYPGAVAVLGDSIAAGTGDDATLRGVFSAPPGYESGYVIRSLASTPHIGLPHPGDTANSFIKDTSHFRRLTLVNGCAFALSEYGVNDIYDLGRLLSAIKADLLTLWTQAAVRGMRVYQTTITPKTTSSDGWTTSAGQAYPSADRESTRTGLNDWIRAGAPIDPTTKAAVAIGTSNALLAAQAGHPLTGFFEVADLAETGRNTGLWRNGYTADGLHPNGAAVVALAPGIDVSKFALAA